jgi:hypothetical protein
MLLSGLYNTSMAALIIPISTIFAAKFELSERLIRASAAGSETSWKILDQIPLIQSFFISKANKQTQTYANPTNAKLCKTAVAQSSAQFPHMQGQPCIVVRGWMQFPFCDCT